MFWRRRREPEPDEQGIDEAASVPAAPDAPETPETPDAPAAPAAPDAAEGATDRQSPPATDGASPPPGSAPPDAPAAPAAPVSYWEAPTGPNLITGLTRTRDAFGSRLSGVLGGPTVDWDVVEETLIGGDVGAGLSGEVVEKARRRHDMTPGAADGAELAALLDPRDGDCVPLGAPDAPASIHVEGVIGTGQTTKMG
jgi:hypothetical protein